MNELPPLGARVLADRLANWRAWRERAVVWLAAIVAGLCVVGFTLLTDAASRVFQHVRGHGAWWPLMLTPLGGMLAVWIARRWAPGSAGSGIPQVMVCLDSSLPAGQVSYFVSARLSIIKSLCGGLALCAGFSSGREGPSVQIAAGIMHGFRRWLGPASAVRPSDLMLAGGAAGIAAAFNTPLAGVVFAIEELSRRFEQRSSGLIVTAIVLAGLVSVSVFGNANYFGRLNVQDTHLSLLMPAALCAVATGCAGGFFSRLLIVSSAGSRDRMTVFRRAHPIWFAGACGLGVALLGLLTGGAVHGSGYELTRGLLAHEESVPFLYAGVKFLATWLSYWSGIPGGIFAPS
ncbi:MAG: chloride channel protein, partial [Rhodocyclaceae bacterium]